MEASALERRKSTRASGIPGAAMVLVADATASYAIEDLSFTGARLVGDLELVEGQRVKLLVHVDGERGFSVIAEVVRAEPFATSRRVAVRFKDVDDDTQRSIEAVVHTALQLHWVTASRAVLVVDDSPDVCNAAQRDLRELGWTIVPATTSIEVMSRLSDRSRRFEAALVDIALQRVNSSALLRLLTDEHPRMQRVVLVTPEHATEGNAEVETGRAHACLQKPWERDALLEAIGAAAIEDTEPHLAPLGIVQPPR